MTTPLTPALALEYVRELSADVIAAAVLDDSGALLAGAEPLAEPARALFEWAATAETGGALIEGATDAGAVFAARAPSHAVVVVTGPFALPRLARHDARTALAAVSGVTIPDGPPSAAPHALVAALLAAAEGPFSRHSAV
jgi:hypothetical protein